MADLLSFLGRGYGAQVLGKEPISRVIKDFRAAAERDPGLLPYARSFLSQLEDAAVLDRDHISRVRVDILRAFLA